MPVVKRTNHGITLKSGIKKGLDEREREKASNKEAAISIKNGIDEGEKEPQRWGKQDASPDRLFAVVRADPTCTHACLAFSLQRHRATVRRG